MNAWYCLHCGDRHLYGHCNLVFIEKPEYSEVTGWCGTCLSKAGRLKRGVLIGTDAYPLVEAAVEIVTCSGCGHRMFSGNSTAYQRDTEVCGWCRSRGISGKEASPKLEAKMVEVDVSAATPAGHPEFYKIVEEMKALHEKKAKDYGLGKDVLANCRGSEDFGIPGWIGVVMRMNDKMTRLKSFAQKGSLANESVEDSLIDIANYAVLAMILYKELSKGVAK